MEVGKKRERWQKISAWMLALVMVLSLVMVPAGTVEAAEDSVVYDLLGGKPLTESGTVEVDPYGGDEPDVFCEHQFNDLDATMLSNLGTYSSLKFEASVKVNSTSGKIPTVVAYSMDAKYGGWKDDGAEVTALGSEVKVALDLTSYKTLSRVGIRFTQCDEGTAVNYTITSAKITAVKSSGGSGGGDITVPVEGLSAKITKLSGNSDWAEYNYSITNSNSTAVKGLKVVIPFSGTVNNFKSFGSCTASKVDNTIVIKYTKEIAANSTYSCTSDDKFGFAGGASLGTPVVSALTEEDNASQLKYPLTGKPQDVPYSDTPVGKHGALHLKEVSGYSTPVIVDESGNPFQLRGASTHGVQWFPEYINKSAFQSLRDEWGVNMVRLACYVTQYNGYTNGGKDTIDNKIVEGVQAAKDLGMYIIVDWHIHEESPHTTKAQALEFFKKYATMYKDYDNVIFEICNEPTGVNWYNNGAGGDLYSYCKEVATVIRDCGSKALIVCGTNTWSQDVDDVAKKPLKDDGFEDILYTFHFYSGSHYDDKMQKVRTALNAGTPIFVTEFGVCDASGNGGYDTPNADEWIKLCDQNNISYACWSLCNKDESASYLLPSCNKKTGGWVEEDLSTSGLWLVNTYRAHEEAEKEKENPDVVSKVTLDKTTLSLGKGESAALKATVSPSTATDTSVTWSSDKPAVATVDQTGKVTAVAAGTAIITVKTTDGGKTATCKVTVTAPGITLNKETLTLKAGASETLKATVTGVTDKTVVWSSSDTKVATVVNGKVTAVAAGTAEITATVGSGADAVKASCAVTVTKNSPNAVVPASIEVKAGSKLSDIVFNKTEFTADVEGTFAWKTTDKTFTIKDNNSKVVVTFTPKNEAAYSSEEKEITILVTKKKYDSAPAAPELSSTTANTVALKEAEQTALVQYGLKQGTAYKWQNNNVFTGLSEYTSYEFALRYSETDIYEASEAGKTLKVTTFFNDANKYKIDLNKLGEANYVEAHGGTISYDADSKVLTLTESDKVYTITGSNKDVEIRCADGVTVKLKGVECKSISGEGDLTVQLENKSVVTEGVKAKESVTIQNGSSTGVGSLTVSSGEDNAAISAPKVTIEGGKIEATGTDSQKSIIADTLELFGGTVIANADSAPPIVADKIILDGGQVSSASNPIYSTDPVDKNGDAVLLCSVTYVNGAESTKTSVKNGSEITLPPLPVKAGYKANGWKLADEDIVSVPGKTMIISEDVTFIADYTEITGTLEVSVSDKEDLVAGYEADSGVTVTIANRTTVTIDEIALVLSNGKEFTISDDNIAGLEPEGSVDVTVTLKNGFGVGSYETDLTVTCVEGEYEEITKSIIRVVGKAASEKPESAPEILAVTENSVTLVPVLVTDKTIEYGIKQTDGSYKWQASNKFTDLESDTTYSFAVRYAETASTNASEPSKTVNAKTLMSLANRYIVDISKLGDKDYVESHGKTISVEGDTLVLEEEATYTITGTNPDLTIYAKEDVTIILDNAEVAAIKGDKNVTIKLVGTSKILSETEDVSAVEAAGTVTISKEENAQTGSVTIQGGAGASGIEADKVIIEDGTVTITGGIEAGGIKADKVVIEDGTVTVTGGTGAAGVEAKEEVTITGGTVTVAGGSGNTAGIDADKVTITGGTVSVTGQGDKPAIDADSKDIQIPIEIINGADYQDPEQSGDVKLVESITVLIDSATIIEDQTATVTAVVLPEDATDKSVTWSSSNEAVATVSPEGVVTAILEGTADIIATANDGSGISGNVSITVVDNGQGYENAIKATGMTITADVKGALDVPVKKTFKLAPKKKMELNVEFLPENAAEEKLTFTSSKPKVATVDEDGQIKAGKKAGTTVITVTSESGLKKTFKVQVMKKPVKKVKIKTSKKVVKVKKKLKLKATLTPNKKQASDSVYWKSSNTKVAVVSASGVVKGIKKGKAKITAVATDGSGKKATVTIQVK